MTIPDATVFVVDDDPLVRESIEQLIKSVGLNVHTFSSAQEFLDQDLPDTPSCLVLDIRMPSLSGLDLQDELVKRGLTTPVIFITGHGSVPMSVRAMKAGAVDFLQKPFEDQDLLDAIHRAIEQNKRTRLEQAEIGEIKRRVESLTSREYEVLVLVVAGMLNKQIAYDLELSEQWTAAGDGKRLMLLVHHTDAEREWAYDRESHIGRLNKAMDEAQARGWVVVDMKKDWKVIYSLLVK